MPRKATLYTLMLCLFIGCIVYLALSEKTAPAEPANTPKKNSRQADTPLARLLRDSESSPANSLVHKDPGLNNAQLLRHLQVRGRSMESLLTTSRFNRRLDLLREANERFPNNPAVLLELAIRSKSPEERRKAIEAIRHLEPDMGLPVYLLALEHFKGGQREAAMSTLLEANSSKFLNYSSVQQWEDIERIYLDNGFTPLEAKFISLLI